MVTLRNLVFIVISYMKIHQVSLANFHFSAYCPRGPGAKRRRADLLSVVGKIGLELLR